MFRFTIRDVLWLTVVVGLAVSWWIDNKRIETSVTHLENDRRMMQAEFQDKLTILDEVTKERSNPRWRSISPKRILSTAPPAPTKAEPLP
jgi:hypothetical protein